MIHSNIATYAEFVSFMDKAMSAEETITLSWLSTETGKSTLTIKKYVLGNSKNPNVSLCKKIIDSVQGKIAPKLSRLKTVSQILEAVA